VYYDGWNNDRYRLTTRTESSYQYNNKFGTSAPRKSRANSMSQGRDQAEREEIRPQDQRPVRLEDVRPPAKEPARGQRTESVQPARPTQRGPSPSGHHMDSLPRLDLTRLQAVESRMVAPRRREDKAGDNAGPSKRKEMHNGRAEELERAGKRQRLDEEQLSSTLYQLRFIVGKKRSMT
jgi:hypothetical protein